MSLTPAQHGCLKAIIQLSAKAGHAPSYREIGDKLGLRSEATVMVHVHALEAAGYIVRHGKNRGIEVVGRCPLCGRAGQVGSQP